MNRRKFFKSIATLFGISTIYLTNKIVTNSKYFALQKKIYVPLNSIQDGINIIEKFIIIKNNENYKVFLSKCTHLGCKINFYENNKIICKCHGSNFDVNGKPISGPADKPLTKLNYKITNDKMIVFENAI